MKRLAAAILTIAVMGLLVWSALRRGSTPATDGAVSREPGVSPAEAPDALTGAEAQVRALLASAQEGNVASYLNAFAEPMRSRLAREIDERGRDAFAADLKRSSAARKSHAIFAPEPDGPDAASVTVESVYPDRNERQTYRLERTEGRWQVTDVASARSHAPVAKFGTPAEYQEPEGVPVQGAPVVDTAIPPKVNQPTTGVAPSAKE